MFLGNIIAALIPLFIYILIVLWCRKMAIQKNRDPLFWIGCALLFSIFALVILSLLSYEPAIKANTQLKADIRKIQSKKFQEPKSEVDMSIPKISVNRQKLVVIIGTLLIVAAFIYPPWKITTPLSSSFSVRSAEFRPIWYSPQEKIIGYEINSGLLCLEIVAIVIISSAFLYAFRRKKRDIEQTGRIEQP